MKLLTLLCLLAVCLLATTGVSQQGVKNDEIKYEMKELEQNYGIKFKAVKLQGRRTDTQGDTPMTITLEFTKEVKADDRSGASLGKLRNLFAGKPGGRDFGTDRDVQLRCYFFDEDGVAFNKQLPGKIEGELSGKAGDAFRITQSVPDAVLAKTKKISFREEPVEKKE
jgi:hypothetical protein